MWHQPCQRCKYTTSVDIQKRAIKKLFTHAESHASAASLLKRGEERYIIAINKQINIYMFDCLAASFCWRCRSAAEGKTWVCSTCLERASRSAVGDSGGDLHGAQFRPDRAGEAVPRAGRHAGVGTVR